MAFPEHTFINCHAKLVLLITFLSHRILWQLRKDTRLLSLCCFLGLSGTGRLVTFVFWSPIFSPLSWRLISLLWRNSESQLTALGTRPHNFKFAWLMKNTLQIGTFSLRNLLLSDRTLSSHLWKSSQWPLWWATENKIQLKFSHHLTHLPALNPYLLNPCTQPLSLSWYYLAVLIIMGYWATDLPSS